MASIGGALQEVGLGDGAAGGLDRVHLGLEHPPRLPLVEVGVVGPGHRGVAEAL